jgi:hypothetical protein
MNRLKALWASLPHPAQALVVAFLSATAEAVAHGLSEPNACFTKACLLHLAKSAVVAGVVAARAFYMLPNRGNPPQQPPANIPARMSQLPPLAPTQPA